MSKILEKSLNVGFGLFSYSKEKIVATVDKLVEKGEIARDDAKEAIDDLVKKGEEQRLELKKMIKDEIKDSAVLEDVATKEDVRNIIKEEIELALKEKEEL